MFWFKWCVIEFLDLSMHIEGVLSIARDKFELVICLLNYFPTKHV